MKSFLTEMTENYILDSEARFYNVGKNIDVYTCSIIEQEVNNIYGMFRTRSILHQKAYQHPVTNGIEMM